MASDGKDALLKRLEDNIAAVQQDPTSPIEIRTFEEAALVLPRSLSEAQRNSLVGSLAGLLAQLQQDPTPAVDLLTQLLDDIDYMDILAFQIPFVDGLAVGDHMIAFNRLLLSILAKATHKPTDAEHVASMLETMLALVRLWLCTGDTGIASKASQLLLDLLRIDQETGAGMNAALPSGGNGLVWKRIFGDKNIYGTFFEACSLKGHSSLKLSRNQRTLAQARLMEWLPRVGGMDWNAISRSHHPEIEKSYNVDGGLLQFAAMHMVDYRDDVLMHSCLVDFYSNLLQSARPSEPSPIGHNDSPALLYLIKSGLHARTVSMYLKRPGAQLDPVDSMFLYGPSANYVATYASSYPQHFLTSQLRLEVIERLKSALDLSPTKWAHADSPKHDLHVVASVPRHALLPEIGANEAWRNSPLSFLPSKSTNADVLNTLATVFHGPEQRIINFPPSSPLPSTDDADRQEASAARSLYYLYLSHNPSFWQNITSHADTIALKEVALAAITCLVSVITANWSAEEPSIQLPSSDIATPDQPAVAILTPPALEHTLPYLLKPPQTFANLVGGRGDAESAAYKIASAKFDALRALHDRLVVQVQQNPGQGYEDIVATLAKKLAEGPLSREGEVGGRIGTLDL